jgi:predicted transposase/invertase (TIGR01784 family)
MLITKYLDPTNDFAFRRIFSAEKNKDILIHFLNDMLVFKGKDPIIDVTFLKTIQDPEIAYKKTSIVDILCRDEKGRQYIVEMQVASSKGFEKRAQYYASKAYVSQARQGGKYENLKEIIFLAITNFDMFPNKPGWKSDHVILDKDTYEHDLKDFSFTFIELPKFHKDIDDLTNITEKWCYFLKHAQETSEKEIQKLAGQDIIIEKAYEEMNRFNWNEEELLTYEQEQKHEWDHQAIMAYRQAIMAYRHDQGMEKGIEKGIEKGMEKRSIEIACAMLADNMDIEDIAKITKLSVEEICKLKNIELT